MDLRSLLTLSAKLWSSSFFGNVHLNRVLLIRDQVWLARLEVGDLVVDDGREVAGDRWSVLANL